MRRLTSVTMVLMGAAACTGAASVIFGTGCGSSKTSANAGTPGPQPVDSALAGLDAGEDTSSPPAEAGPSDDATTTEEELGDGANPDGTSPDCDGNFESGSCAAICTDDASVNCTIEFAAFSCELVEFADASAMVACGQTASVGTASCGGCGSVAVEVYYDGRRCWEGIPGCMQGGASAIAEYEGRWFEPHAP